MPSKAVAAVLRNMGFRRAGQTEVFVLNMDPKAKGKKAKKLERDAIKRARRLK